MKVLILSTYEHTGGAAIAANRLLHALQQCQGMQATMLSRRNISWWPKRLKPQSYSSLWERCCILWHLLFTCRGDKGGGHTIGLRNALKSIWAVDMANCGQDITQTREYREADVIHLHWINQGFISLNTIEKMLHSGKRIVWTMHDEWPLEGIEHYTCGGSLHDALNNKVAERKRRIYSQGQINFVTCSQWLGNIARQKPLGVGQRITSIPNPIDTTLFQPLANAKTSFSFDASMPVILFACQKVTDKRKGLDYLIEAARQLSNASIALVGSNTDAVAQMMPQHIKTYSLGTIRDVNIMSRLYAACDCFVTPSLQDNLPNTIMEAMSCGTPCVGFRVGGIPEMIDHCDNGYVAEYCNATDLAKGIEYVLDAANHARLSVAARMKVERCYSEQAVARRYLEVYS